MKNFLKVLLVGTILVSATDGFTAVRDNSGPLLGKNGFFYNDEYSTTVRIITDDSTNKLVAQQLLSKDDGSLLATWDSSHGWTVTSKGQELTLYTRDGALYGSSHIGGDHFANKYLSGTNGGGYNFYSSLDYPEPPSATPSVTDSAVSGGGAAATGGGSSGGTGDLGGDTGDLGDVGDFDGGGTPTTPTSELKITPAGDAMDTSVVEGLNSNSGGFTYSDSEILGGAIKGPNGEVFATRSAGLGNKSKWTLTSEGESAGFSVSQDGKLSYSKPAGSGAAAETNAGGYDGSKLLDQDVYGRDGLNVEIDNTLNNELNDLKAWNEGINGPSEWDVMQTKSTELGGTLTEYRNGSQVYEIGGTKFIKKKGESYFRDANGDEVGLPDREAYTGFNSSGVVTSVPVTPTVSTSGLSASILSINGDTALVKIGAIEYNLPVDKLNGATSGSVVLSPDAIGSLSTNLSSQFAGAFSNLGAGFKGYFNTALDMVKSPFTMAAGAFKLLTGDKDAWKAVGDAFSQAGDNLKNLVGLGDKITEEVLKQQAEQAARLTPAQVAEVQKSLSNIPAWIFNPGEYPIQIMQTVEAGKQNDTTKQVKVKAENGLLDSQGAPSDSTVDEQLQGTNLASAASQMVVLLEYNPVDLNLLKMDDLDLSKDKDQKTLRQRRDLLLQMYATSAQIIAEGSNDISEKFYERISLLSESLPQTTGSLGSASVLNDSERYPYFEMVRQTALSATQLGLKGADILPNLRTAAPESQEQ